MSYDWRDKEQAASRLGPQRLSSSRSENVYEVNTAQDKEKIYV